MGLGCGENCKEIDSEGLQEKQGQVPQENIETGGSLRKEILPEGLSIAIHFFPSASSTGPELEHLQVIFYPRQVG